MSEETVRRLASFVAALAIAALFLGGALAWRFSNLDRARVVAREDHPDGSHSVMLLSTSYNLDRIYKSMQGPRSNHAAIRLAAQPAASDTVWLTGIEVDVVDAESLQPVSEEYFCHSNLTFDPETITPENHNASFTPEMHCDWRLFTLIPGRMNIQLPEGFGIPIRSETLLDNFTMALNQNAGARRRVRVQTTVSYRGGDLRSLRPLFRRSLYVYQQHAEVQPPAGISRTSAAQHEGEHCAESCSFDQTGLTPSWFVSAEGSAAPDAFAAHPGATCCVANASAAGVVEQFGAENTVHWMIPPGLHRYRTEVTEQMALPFDATIHYVTGHLHPFGKKLALIDLNSGETVFEITAEGYSDRLGVAAVSEIVSRQGFPIKKDGRYELSCEYQNTSKEAIDAMAILYIYALDHP